MFVRGEDLLIKFENDLQLLNYTLVMKRNILFSQLKLFLF